MKHIRNFDLFLFEKKMDIMDYPNLDTLGLVVKSSNRNSVTTKNLALFDFKTEETLAYIELRNLIDREVFEVEKASAEKGWGPLIYDYALMFSYPKSVAPSKTIKPSAINVWKYYYDLRPDVIKKEMGVKDESYSDKYRNHIMDDMILSDDNLLYLNTYYSLIPSIEFKDMVQKGSLLLKNSGMLPSNIFNFGNKHFDNSYL